MMTILLLLARCKALVKLINTALQINASDDRSASMIESKVLDVVQMNSVMPHSKPKCLVSLTLPCHKLLLPR